MNLIPRDDQSEFEVSVITPEGYSLERTDRSSWPSSKGGCGSSRATMHLFTTIGETAGGRIGQGPGGRDPRDRSTSA